jgi:tetratricopeptide (TPR) repeat protein
LEQGELGGAIEEYTRTIRLIDEKRAKSAPEPPTPSLAPSAARVDSLGATVNASAALSGRATAYLASKDAARALVDADRAVRLALEDDGGLFRLAVVKNTFKFSFNFNSDRYLAFLARSRVQSALGNLDLARKDARRAIDYARTDDQRREGSKLADSLGK